MAPRLLLPLLMLAATFLIAQAQGIGTSASDCCLKHSQKNIPGNLIKSYRIQGPESGCFLHAVVITTQRGRKICASPTDPTIQNLMQNPDKMVKKDKKVKNNKKDKKGQSLRARSRAQRQKPRRV
ncbi:PREDICTED: C-C motif chemokine 21 [Buceros rhinoceros silvestris]|uniref:C-C motif chemokine 21 n=1 Tax=Buceros rhinoceros silvestris TaxID=175836 RepID=UPI000528A20E|nr:PREDICTED: C-C motif chemokine 21 [Buceros rhinoceros silvestris]